MLRKSISTGVYGSLGQALGAFGGSLIVRSSKDDSNRYFAENVSASLGVGADFIELGKKSKMFNENIAASLSVGTDFVEVFYTNEKASETVSAAITGLTISYTSE